MKYRATLTCNVRAYCVDEFEAADDGAAMVKVQAIMDWRALGRDASRRDAVVTLDELDSSGNCCRTVEKGMKSREV